MADENSRMHSSASSSNAGEIVHYFNSKNAKIVAVFLVIGFVIYHGIIHMAYGIDSCKWLLSDGRLQGYLVWQPYGCMMHTYSDIDSKRCMRYIAYWGGKNHIVFLGDSRIRQLYYEMVKHFNPDDPLMDTKAHGHLKFSDEQLKLTVEFLWQPVVNSSMMEVYESWVKGLPEKRPKVIVTGSATWSIKESNASLNALLSYKDSLAKLVPNFDRLAPTTKVLWMLQDPIVPDKLEEARRAITNEQIDLYNKAAMEILRSSLVQIWSSSRLVSQGYNQDCEDGIHIGKVALKYDTQILFNMYCNDHMNFEDGTCCSSAESVTTLQIVTLSIFTVFIILAISMIIYRCKMKKRKLALHRPLEEGNNADKKITCDQDKRTLFELATTLAKLGLVMVYFFLCDRTNFFMKENKYYSNLNFFLPFAYVFALGLFFTEETSQTKVLHRDQTDEWKGWMQLVILIYHMTGASHRLPIYMHIRLLVTSYLFLTGFGHFTYFWHFGDYGFTRLFQVLFRLNLLVVVLCLTMNRPYQFYYFVPLVSFWFLVVYVTMSTFPRVTSTEVTPLHYLYVVLKFVGLFGVVTILYMSEVFFEKIFVTRPWKALFVTMDDSIKEWWFRWKIDRYSVGYGMMFAFAYYLLKHYRLIDDNNHGNLFSRSISCAVVFLSIVGLAVFSGFALLCRNKAECNEVHPYLAFLPTLSYVVLRNISGLLRTRYSTFFAWFGKISLELFICQYHIWLAADTHGVLVLVPNYPVLNLIVTSFIFLCVAHEMHTLTWTLAKYAIPSDWRYLVRNLIIFLIILVPIGIHDGMF